MNANLAHHDPTRLRIVTSREDLAAVERMLRDRKAAEAMRAGTTILRPETVTLDDTVALEPDTVLEPFVTLLGKTRVGSGTAIGQGTVARDTVFGKNVTVRPYCHARQHTSLRRWRIHNIGDES